jgi:hypothetical protein
MRLIRLQSVPAVGCRFQVVIPSFTKLTDNGLKSFQATNASENIFTIRLFAFNVQHG